MRHSFLAVLIFFILIGLEVKAEDYKLFFGDLHGHTFWSDGKGSPAEYFTYCRDVAKLDFCAITDHDPNSTALANITAEADIFNSPKFVAFSGYEWSSWTYGHKACYNVTTPCRAGSSTCNTTYLLYDSVKKDGGLCHAAHPAASWYDNKTGKTQNPTDWSFSNDEVEIAGEIYNNETKMNEAWSNYSLKIGVVGVSDTHDGRPGSSGITGCYATELTRKGILEALKARRCFATSSGANRTHFPMNLSFKINGHWMGEEFSVDYGSILNFEITVNATYTIKDISIKKNGVLIAKKSDCNSINCFWFFSSVANDSSYYYIVVTTTANKISWSSPIWIKLPYDFIISENDSFIYALNVSTNKVDFRSENATEVIQRSIDLSKNIFIKKAVYNVTTIEVKNGTRVISNGAVLRAVDEGIVPFTLKNLEEFSPLAPVLFIVNASNVEVEGLEINGGNMFRTYRRPGILIYDSEDILIRNCNVSYTYGVGIWVGSSGTYNLNNPKNSSLKTKRVTIEGCHVHRTLSNLSQPTKGFGIDFWFSQDSLVRDNFVYETNESAYRAHYSRNISFFQNFANYTILCGEPFDIYRSSDILIKNNTIYDDDAGVYMYEYVDNVTVESNFIKTWGSDAPIRLKAVAGYLEDKMMSNIKIVGNEIYGSVWLRQSNLQNITIFNNTLHGGVFVIPNSSFSIIFKNLTVEGNLLLSSHLPNRENSIILTNVSNVYLKNNKIQNNTIKIRFSNYTQLVLENYGLSFYTNQSLNITILDYFVGKKVRFSVEGVSGSNVLIQLDNYPLKPFTVKMNVTILYENEDWFWSQENRSLRINFTMP